jgi:hypothetical protein
MQWEGSGACNSWCRWGGWEHVRRCGNGRCDLQLVGTIDAECPRPGYAEAAIEDPYWASSHAASEGVAGLQLGGGIILSGHAAWSADFLGAYFHDSSGALKKVEVVYEADLEDAILELDLQEFGDEVEQKALRTLLLRYRDLFSAKTSTVLGFEFGLDIVDGADLSKLNRPAFPKSRVEKELEAERVRELIDRGILVPS